MALVFGASILEAVDQGPGAPFVGEIIERLDVESTGGQLYCERKAVQEPAQFADRGGVVLGERKTRIGVRRSSGKELHRRALSDLGERSVLGREIKWRYGHL